MSIFGTRDSGIKIVTSGLSLWTDAAQLRSYPGTGTSIVDISGNTNPMTLTNGPTFNSGNGGYFTLDGTNDYIITTTATLNLGANASNNVTMGVWVYPTTINDNHILGRIYDPAAPTNDCGYNIQSNGAIGYYVGGYNVFGNTSANAVAVNNWYYIVFAYDRLTVPRPRLYVNGTRYTGMNEGNFFTGIPNNTACNAAISNVRGFNNYFVGRTAIFHVYNRTLTDAEVLQNYNATKVRFGL